jgi:uncharacterized damage-inducible protein DinB
MQTLDATTQVRALVAYNERANTILLDALDGLTGEQLDAECASQGSILGTMEHIVWAQNIWLGRWGVAVADGDGSLRNRFELSHAALRDFIESRSIADLAANVDYADSRGAQFSVPLWQLVTHLCNHGTHHRAECGLLLGELGRSPGDIDFYLFMRGAI